MSKKNLTPTEPLQPITAVNLLARLRQEPATTVQTALDATVAAFREGSKADIAAALVEQVSVLQELARSLVQRAGDSTSEPGILVFVNLALKAFEAARRSAETLERMMPVPNGQTN